MLSLAIKQKELPIELRKLRTSPRVLSFKSASEWLVQDTSPSKKMPHSRTSRLSRCRRFKSWLAPLSRTRWARSLSRRCLLSKRWPSSRLSTPTTRRFPLKIRISLSPSTSTIWPSPKSSRPSWVEHSRPFRPTSTKLRSRCSNRCRRNRRNSAAECPPA